ncbi:kinesin-like protein Cin8p [[Candida] jaroonii]|uniref:Kinesin-like protein Cin8p n=1 Tax=[Candida] jaroonii TaxID=467808 RepID=A0ACA9Y510_9ASCO|nr:kinesin-like protein Cin8p [[Candida] jaroonii]
MSNIQVVVRCRGRNARELNAKSQVIVELPSDTYSIAHPTITINQNTSSQLSQKIINSIDSKTYNFDQIYGPLADQGLIFEKVVTPLFKDFLNGFNVTILAYGQTGTGKTYTMYGKEDDEINDSGFIHKNSGIIPRIISDLFEKINDNEDFMIKCSFIELYNENLKDLLDDDEKSLKIFENKNNSSQSITISNLKEVCINDLTSGFNVLKSGLNKRKVASTKLNNFSSRSHTIFTIHLFKKTKDHEFFRYSKINLVDLAGSENINKSGSINQRAKEAGSINQSLLTLGRVINSLSNKISTNHIPYRESKLTRFLQDSLGGKTKTLLISTISPAKINCEETLSTLEYSLKVRNIENKPQLGKDFSVIMKQTLIKDLSNEIIKLNNDLISTRNKNGIYMNENNYNKLVEENNSNRNEILELKSKVKSFESKINILEDENNQLKTKEIATNDQLHDLNDKNLILQKKINQQKDDALNSLNLIEKLLDDNSTNMSNNSKLHELNRSLKDNLMMLKLNFNNNHGKISEEINNSLKDLPNYLIELINDLNNNDETFKQFSDQQTKNLERIAGINKNLNEFLINYSIDYNSLISKFIDQSVNKKLQDFKQEFLGKFQNLLNNEFGMMGKLIENEMIDYSSKFMQENKSTIIAKTNNWNSNSHHLIDKVFNNFQEFKENFNVLTENNQLSITKTSTDLKNSINNTIVENLTNLSKDFSKDMENLSEIVPLFNDINQINSKLAENEGIDLRSLKRKFPKDKSPSKKGSYEDKENLSDKRQRIE